MEYNGGIVLTIQYSYAYINEIIAGTAHGIKSTELGGHWWYRDILGYTTNHITWGSETR